MTQKAAEIVFLKSEDEITDEFVKLDEELDDDEPKEEDDMSGASGIGHEPNDPENER